MFGAYKVKIKWSKELSIRDLAKYKAKKREHLYLILNRRCFVGVIPKRTILYIGMAYKQEVTERLREHHKLPKITRRKLMEWGDKRIRIGRVKIPFGRRMTRKLIQEIEAALIYDMQPEHNERNKKKYRGRSLKIINCGRRKPLDKRIITNCFK